MNFLYEFGQRIKKLRILKGMTQEELAQKMGYTSRSTINKIEKGLIDIPQSKIEEFSKILNVTPWGLMGWNDVDWHKKVSFRLTEKNFKMKILKSEDDELYKLIYNFDNDLEVTLILSEIELQAIADAMFTAIKGLKK